MAILLGKFTFSGQDNLISKLKLITFMRLSKSCITFYLIVFMFKCKKLKKRNVLIGLCVHDVKEFIKHLSQIVMENLGCARLINLNGITVGISIQNYL